MTMVTGFEAVLELSFFAKGEEQLPSGMLVPKKFVNPNPEPLGSREAIAATIALDVEA